MSTRILASGFAIALLAGIQATALNNSTTTSTTNTSSSSKETVSSNGSITASGTTPDTSNAPTISRGTPAVVPATDGTGATQPGNTATNRGAIHSDNPPGTYGQNGLPTGTGTGQATNPGQNNSLSEEVRAGVEADEDDVREANTNYREHWWQFWRDERPTPMATDQ